jgi:putative protein kinase ArgK-like GTPase of G3E family
LDEFYSQFLKNAVGVSAVTGDGIPEFWNVVEEAASVDFGDYVEDLKHRIQEQEAKKMAMARANAKKFQRDVDQDNSARAKATQG